MIILKIPLILITLFTFSLTIQAKNKVKLKQQAEIITNTKHFKRKNTTENLDKTVIISTFLLKNQYLNKFFLDSFITAYSINNDDRKAELHTSQAYYQTPFKNNPQFQWIMGRKHLESAVGYAFKPLNLIGKNTLSNNGDPIKGRVMTGFTYFTESASNQLTLFIPEQQSEQRINYYRKDWGMDFLMNTYYNNLDLLLRFQLQGVNSSNYQSSHQLTKNIAGGGSWIVNDVLVIHASSHLLTGGWVFEFNNTPPLINPLNRIQIKENSNWSSRSLVGINYTPNTIFNIIGEYWHNANTPDKKFWISLNQFIANQQKLAIPPETSQVLTRNNLGRENLFIRLATSQIEQWKFSFNWQQEVSTQDQRAEVVTDYQTDNTLWQLKLIQFTPYDKEGIYNLITEDQQIELNISWVL